MSIRINPDAVVRTARSEMTMKIARMITRSRWAALGTMLSLALLVPASQAQFKVTENFNRNDGAPGLGWSVWGNGAQISENQLQTYGQFDTAGGIARTLDTTFPASFAFDFSTATPSDGGWSISFNAADTTWDGNFETAEVRLMQFSGSQGICLAYQTAEGPVSKCGSPKTGQRDFTATAHITGTVYANFAAMVTITYNDGLSPAQVTLTAPAPAGAIVNPLGSIFYFGNSNQSYGPHTFDNFSLTLK